MLSYILNHYKNITLSAIIGFIVGSLGVVWPWKTTQYKLAEDGAYILDSTGTKVVLNYQRYIPTLNTETYYAIAFIVLGIVIVLALEYYGQKTREIND
jgi:putative membrane protein